MSESENVGPEIPMEPEAKEEPEEETGEPQAKKRKAVNAAEFNLLDNLPAAERYERSQGSKSALFEVTNQNTRKL